MADLPMSPTERPVDPTFTRGAQLDDDIVVIDLTGAEPVVTRRSALVDLREAVDGRVRDGRWGLLLLLAALQVLDVFTTHLVLANGGAEGNPIMQSIVSEGWGGPLVIKLAAIAFIAAIVAVCPERSLLVRRGLTAVTGIYVAIVTWNLAVLLALA
jgi:hypothetical protein